MIARHAARCLGATLIGLAVIISGCVAAPGPPPPSGPPPANEAGPLPPECPSRITDADQARTALQRVQPASLVCLSGDRLRDAELQVRTSGTREQPIRIISDGAAVRSLTVKADYVVIQGLTLMNGDGLTMTGRGLLARQNVVYNATADGVECRSCTDAVIESNIVQRADGTGIWISGERITVRNNTVSESVLRTQGDADGIRFFGRGHRLTQNTIRDIKASGYGAEGPHTDCFQTYDSPHEPPTYDIVIADNVCTNVDVQCLIATNDGRGPSGAPAGRTAIIFERNRCAVNGAQAVLLRGFPQAVIRDNRFSGPGERAVMLTEGSTDVTVINNVVTGRLRPFDLDRQSEPGFRASGNT
jgi:parallel beta-helix repeat protein